ncbi:MAG: HAMP domain-containing sensor histidine kinase [Pseudomonadota bacterium]
MSRFQMLLRTTAVRMSALYFGLFTVCAVVLVFYVTDLTSSLLTSQTKQVVQDEIKVLGNFYRRGGVSMLIGHIDRRSREPGANLYAIAASNGQILAGNVESLQDGVFDQNGWTDRPFTYRRFYQPEGTPGHAALAEVIFMPNGMRVLVGRDLGQPTRFRSMVQRSLALALGIMVIGALVIWLFIGRGALQRIDRMSLASQKIMDGDLGQRLPVSGSGDEFDRLSESLNDMIGRIERLNEGLRQVSDNIAHDLKTPLTRLRNRAEAALAGQEDGPAYRAAMEDVIDESDQLIRTFNALLMISRVEAGSAVAEMNSVDLSRIALDAGELYEPVAEEANVALITRIASGIGIHGNRELIGQALTNLIDNAIKYSAGQQDAAEVEVILEIRDEAVVLSVTDNGPGIPENRREDVKKRFVRLDESRSKPGTGLGLSLVDAIMALHGGRLDLTSNPKGASGLCARMVFDKRG